MIAAKIMNNYEKWQKNTKNDKNIDIFDHDCSENHEKLWKIIKNDKNIDIFEYDCSEHHEQFQKPRHFEKYLGHFWVVILELGAETLSESRSFYAPQISFKSWFC